MTQKVQPAADQIHEASSQVSDQPSSVSKVDLAQDTTKASALVEKQVTRDPHHLSKPLDYEECWYEGEDGLMYNEYDDELEEGYYYSDEPKAEIPKEQTKPEPSPSVEALKGLPRPADYEDYWYEGEDGLMYNEYDDELEEGQFYAEPVLASKLKPNEFKNKNEDAAATAASEASKAAEEAAKAAAEASKNLLKGMSGLGGGFMDSLSSGTKPKADTKSQSGFGFGGLGGLFGSTEPSKKPAPKPVQTKKPEPKTQDKPATVPTSLTKTKTALTPASAPASPPAPAPTLVSAPAPVTASIPVAQSLSKPEPVAKSEPIQIPLDIPKQSEQTNADSKPEINEDDLINKPCTARMTARQRWRWAYSFCRQVTPAEQVNSRT